MKVLRQILALAAAAALAGCGEQGAVNSVTYPGVSLHSSFFLLEGTPHDPTKVGGTVTCTNCHRPDFGTFRQFTCTDCHVKGTTDNLHSIIAAAGSTAFTGATTYAWRSDACYVCHRDGLGISIQSHAAFFPIGTAAHPAVCTSCHGVITDVAQRKDLARLQCATCHAGRAAFAGKHALVKDYPAAPTPVDCLRCHGNGQVDAVAAHQARFPVAVTGAAHGGACLQCHQATRADKTYAADFSKAQVSCATACHDTAGAAVAGHLKADCDAEHSDPTYAYVSAKCLECHPNGTGGAPANHPALFPIGAGTKHAGIGCASCHLGANRKDVTLLGCVPCHTTAGKVQTVVNTTNHGTISRVQILTIHTSENTTTTPLALNSQNCVRCHADSQVNTVASHTTSESGFGKGEHRSAGCVTCHDVYRTDKAWATDWKKVNGGAGGRCRVCH